ncbi:MAG: protein kinase [Acidobacteriota bacterium]
MKDPYHLVGLTLMDKYRILALIGLGGMGAVYCAHHLGIDRRVAFKILQPNIAIGSDYVVELFEREAKLAGRLTHENIVDVSDAGHTPDGIAYIVMEWLEGRTLDDELASEGSFDFKRAIGIIRQITAALGEAHGKRVVHRDLKPGNIMLLDTPDGRDHVKVLDFGIGKIIEETTANSPVSALVGTPQYASPEQLTVGGHIDGRSDIYSLGVIFYRLLGGQLPFNSSSMGELLQMQLTVAPQPLSAIRPGMPRAIENLVNNMLAKDPAGRPQSASEVLMELNRIPGKLNLQGLDSEDEKETLYAAEAGKLKATKLTEQTTEDILATARQTPDPTPRPSRRNKSYAVYGIAVVAMMLAGIYGLYQYRFDDGRNDGLVSGEQPSTLPSPSPAQVNATSSQPEPSASVVATPRTSPNRVAPRLTPAPSPTVNRVQIQVNQQKAAEHFRRSRELYNQGEFQSALRACNESLRLNPQQPEARKFRQKINDTIKVLNRR